MSSFEWCFMLPGGSPMRWNKVQAVPQIGDIVRLAGDKRPNYFVRVREWKESYVSKRDFNTMLKLYIHLGEVTNGDDDDDDDDDS